MTVFPKASEHSLPLLGAIQFFFERPEEYPVRKDIDSSFSARDRLEAKSAKGGVLEW